MTAMVRRFAGAVAIAAVLVVPALAQEFKPDPVDEAAARREGALTWYTSTPVAAAQHIAKTFEQKYSIKVELLRTGGQNVIRRFQQAADAGRIAVDVITMSDMSAANAMTRRGLFVPFKPQGFDKVMADPSFTAIQLVVVATLSKNIGWQFYEALRKNDTLIVQGHEQIFDMVKR